MPNAYPGWRRGIAAAVASAVVLGGASLTGAQQKAPEPAAEIFSASVVYTSPAGEPDKTRQRETVHLVIEQWSTEAERQALVQAFEQKGPAGLLSALRETKRLGTLRKTFGSGWDLHYAVQEPTADGGRRIIVGTDRLVDHWEANREAKASYPFTLVELHVDKEGKGDGRVSLATKISRSKDGKLIELEHYAAEPLRLENVRKQKD